MEYLYLFIFLVCIPVVWNILISLKFEGIFKSGKIWQIRCAYVFATLIISHLVAIAIETFSIYIYALM